VDFVNRTDHPDWFKCPITLTLMTDPVMIQSGITYDRPAIEEWLQHHQKCPITNKRLSNTDVSPNMSLRHAIIDYYQKTGGEKSGSKKKSSRRGGRRRPFSKKGRKNKRKTKQKKKSRKTGGRKRRTRKRMKIYRRRK
jgi:hypothetical protein